MLTTSVGGRGLPFSKIACVKGEKVKQIYEKYKHFDLYGRADFKGVMLFEFWQAIKAEALKDYLQQTGSSSYNGENKP